MVSISFVKSLIYFENYLIVLIAHFTWKHNFTAPPTARAVCGTIPIGRLIRLGASAAADEVKQSIFSRGTLLPNPANDNLRVQPRGLRRADAARYLGMSPSHFDAQRKAGNIPAPKQMLGVVLWDRQDLDRLFDGVSVANENDGYWDKACGSESLNS